MSPKGENGFYGEKLFRIDCQLNSILVSPVKSKMGFNKIRHSVVNVFRDAVADLLFSSE